jgi:hypothetical protein
MYDINISEESTASIFWVTTPRSDMVWYQRFGGPWCLYLQGEGRKTNIQNRNEVIIAMSCHHSTNKESRLEEYFYAFPASKMCG